jgi:glycosyltransferase involved in cell wall biosynthesis
MGRSPATATRARRRACIVRQTDMYEPAVQREAEALANAGFDVEVLCMRFPGRPRRVEVDGVSVISLPASLHRSGKVRYAMDYAWFFLLTTVVLTARHLRRRYTVVQMNTMPDFLVFAAIGPKLLGSRVVAYMNEPTPELAETLYGSGRLTRALERIEQRALRFADHAVTVTEQLKQRYVERGAQEDRITVVLNGTAPSTRLAGWRPPASKVTEGFTVICHGAIEDRYGQDTIVEAARLLRDELPDLRTVFTGRGLYEAQLLELIDSYGLQDVVRFEGWVSEERLNDLLHCADAGIVAQKASPYSHLVHTNKMVDYWILGLPVIASRLRAVSATYEDTVLEYFDAGDPVALAAAIRRLHDDPDRRNELSRNGMLAHERNGWPVQRDIYLAVFERLLKEEGLSPRQPVAASVYPSPARDTDGSR